MASAQSIATARASQAELARLFGVSRQAINDLVRRNVLELGHDGRIDVELARVALSNRVRPSAKTAAAVSSGGSAPQQTTVETASDESSTVTSYHVAKTLRETAEARMAQLKLAELRGDLMPTADVRATWSKRTAGLREAILQIPARLAAVVAAESDQARCHDILQAELHAVLQQVTEA